MHIVLSPGAGGAVTLWEAGPDGGSVSSRVVAPGALAAEVRRREAHRPRWVWADTASLYPRLLAEGVRVDRCVDLRLCHAILRRAHCAAGSALASGPRSGWDTPPDATAPAVPDAAQALFDLEAPVEVDPLDAVAELQAQRAALAHVRSEHGPDAAGRLELLLAAESAGALVAAEMSFAGLPWSAAAHDELLTGLLGPRPAPGYRP
ncbi:MAG: bifunctional 3'-5' exonuclease/DNA polymerase, partial [Cellulomonadaceae bacterium]